MFREYVLAGYATSAELIYTKMGTLVYIGLLGYIAGVGVLGSLTAVICLIAALSLLIYGFKHQIASKLGFAVDVPNLEVI